ncbi:MAG TPA: hypothetical protein DEV93_01140 [Chloroflexi bacterium]|nr:hypothetical protein [Chloroflexota bacterium]
MRRSLAGLIVLLASTAAAHEPSEAQARLTAASSCGISSPKARGGSSQLTKANNAFAFNLLRHVDARGGITNAFISPASLAIGLEMAYDGARGRTRTVMANTLGLRGLSPGTVRSEASAFVSALTNGDAGTQIEVANALWARAGIHFNPAFAQRIVAFYDARATTADFSSASTLADINGWVSCATHHTISSIVSRLNPDEVMLLLNTVYFHGDWAAPFPNSDTHPATFNTEGGVAKQMPFMNRHGTYAFSRGSNYQSISLPYGNGRFAMKVVLPAKGVNLHTFVRSLTLARWQSMTGSTSPTDVALRLPRFTIHTSNLLNGVLASMGMASAMRPGANFTGICRRCLISRVIHKTFLRVNEKGTTASAVTGVSIGITAIGANHADMIVDRPFLLTLQDAKTHGILFSGWIGDPTA